MNKIDLGGVATKADRNTSHPTIEPDNETLLLLEQWVPINASFKSVKNQSETLSRQISQRIKHLFFSKFAGLATVSTVLATTTKGTVKLIFKNSYSKKLTDWALLVAAIGKDKAEKYFRYSTVLEFTIDALTESEQEPCANAIIELAKERGWLAAISAKQFVAPKAGFHEARTTVLTAEENEKLDQVLPITAFPQL